MAVWMDRNTMTISQMGGEGVAWLGVAGQSARRHIFANMGERHLLPLRTDGDSRRHQRPTSIITLQDRTTTLWR